MQTHTGRKGPDQQGGVAQKGEDLPEVQRLQPGAPVGVPQNRAREEDPGVGSRSEGILYRSRTGS